MNGRLAGAPPRARAALTAASFERLLAFLDPDREAAGARYEAIRRRLVTFFECRGAADPEDRADETIDRVGRRLAAGEQIRALEPASYFYGVARNVLREAWKQARREPVVPAQGGSSFFEDVDDDEAVEEARRLECLDRCLAALPAEDRDLILWYYQRGERVLVGARRELAGRLGIPLNALRIRAHRIRHRLEACVRRRLAARGAEEMEMPSAPPHGRGAIRRTGGEA